MLSTLERDSWCTLVLIRSMDPLSAVTVRVRPTEIADPFLPGTEEAMATA